MSEQDPLKILVVDDDKNIRKYCKRLLAGEGYTVITAGTRKEALSTISEEPRIGVVLLDLKMPDVEGLSLLETMLERNQPMEIIMISAYSLVDRAVEAIKKGATDFIEKPFKKERLLTSVEKSIQMSQLQKRLQELEQSSRPDRNFPNVVGRSKAMEEVYATIKKASDVEGTVFILGESGTGKDLVAKTIHNYSRRASGPFIPVNCAALPDNLIESELFGHKKGAFTGATEDSIGLFRAAEGGTLFLDEVIEIPTESQAKLLRALQERKIRPVGGTEEVEINVRLMAATNRDPEEALKEGKLREDLYYRLSVLRLELPPLVDRIDDIPLLADHFLNEENQGMEDEPSANNISPEALRYLMQHDWPGNVRELENVINHAQAMAPGTTIKPEHLPDYMSEQEPVEDPETHKLSMGDNHELPTLEEAERELIKEALVQSEGNKSEAARKLDISRNRLYRRLDKYEIDVDELL